MHPLEVPVRKYSPDELSVVYQEKRSSVTYTYTVYGSSGVIVLYTSNHT